MATEKRLIDADKFLQWVVKRFKCIPLVGSSDNDSESMKLLLAQAPTVDAVEVVHGRWEKTYVPDVYQCTNCKRPTKMDELCDSEILRAYCPNCGAKMDGGTDNG